jgi:hypothetical protein
MNHLHVKNLFSGFLLYSYRGFAYALATRCCLLDNVGFKLEIKVSKTIVLVPVSCSYSTSRESLVDRVTIDYSFHI